VRIFSTKGTKLVEIAKERFLLESEVQQLTEANLQDLFDLTLVKSEFELYGLRIDTLAFDKESGAFVIIEYKKDRNFSIVDLLTGNVRRPWMRPRKFSFGC
jgi:RecB family endonuclease NucS